MPLIYMKEFAKRLYKSNEWKRLRDNVIRRDYYICQDCISKGIFTPADEVHHIIPVTADNINDPSITLNPENLISLCRKCHKQRHLGKKRFLIGENGEVITD